ncbi:MAG: hypothetical protein K2N94_07215 [Lachnospiraceae bacterium]|nr:hypothetical protein [Lachnospiraceae bacterium]
MKKESTATRLKQIMQERQLRQVDILEKCKPFCKKFNIKLGRNDLSQYVNGKVEPGQDKLTILGMALNVSEAWLMGFDVPIERESFEPQWNRDAKQFESHINAFYYQMQSLGWTYEWLEDENLYRFSNGTAFFKISAEKYSNFIESSQKFCKELLEKFYDEYHEQTKILLFAKNDFGFVNAAHIDESSTLEERQADDQIMMDDSEWE